ncbi:phosphoglucomutase [Marinilabiliaceae bacterium ANBcel2]|nr:phosphoglucomutase [Marinilabiliaceae bacterium ANBcel2]
MDSTDWKTLHNGSDIRGVATEGVKDEEVTLTPLVAGRLSESFAGWLKESFNITKPLKIAVGIDSRLSGPKLKEAVSKSLIDCGVTVFDIGMASSPAMFMTTIRENNRADGAIMITGSHMPFNRNGLKFYTAKGSLEKEDITLLIEMAQSKSSFLTGDKGEAIKEDYMKSYAKSYVDMVREQVNNATDYNKPLKELKIVVDAGNGAGGFYATDVLEPLGADISESLLLEPDGRFPHHIPNPENEAAMTSVVHRVKESKADLGIVFDADVDRTAIVAGDGSYLNKNKLIALVSAVVLEEHPETTVVTDSITSNSLGFFITEKLKGKIHRYKRGYKNVINEAIRLNNEGEECHLAIETSGHAALKENYFMDDGAYLITKLIIKQAKLQKEGRTLTSLIEDMPLPAENGEVRIKINTPDFKEYGEKVIMDLGLYAGDKHGWDIEGDNFEGVRINCYLPNQKGWVLLRMSLHEPVIPLNIESEVKGGLKNIVDTLTTFFSNYDKLDLSGFKNILY